MERARLDLPTMKAPGVEKEFYLRSFRHRGLLVNFAGAHDVAACEPVVRELTENAAMVVLVSPSFERRRNVHVVPFPGRAGDATALLPVGAELLESHCTAVTRPRGWSTARTIAFCRSLCARLSIDKLVLCDPRGGIVDSTGRRSFLTARALQAMLARGDRLAPWRRDELEALLGAAAGSTIAVNLTAASQLGRELFTYEGSGTLITRDRYCRIRSLGVSDFGEAVGLIRRGEREGFLLERNPTERMRLLLTGYGAWFGNAGLAGVVSLETESYRRNRLGEIRGLYTITRFQGEGVGPKLLAHLLREARQRGLRAVFACTSNARAGAFFERYGFHPLPPSRLPRAKWRGGARRARPAAFWLDL